MVRIKLINQKFRINGETIDLHDKEVRLVKDYQTDEKGGFIIIDGTSCDNLPNKLIKLRAKKENYTLVQGDPVKAGIKQETDEEIMNRLRDRFQILEDMTKATKKGAVKAMIVSGPPGVGKSHGVETVLRKHDIISSLGNSEPKYEFVKGAMSALGLYAKLYQYKSRDCVVVFDDNDSLFMDEVSLNILKAALDSKKKRTISWNTDSRKLKSEDIPDRFDFEGSVIFITNLDFANIRSKKLQAHLEALESRCHYIDLTIHTEREKMLRIKQVIDDGMLDDHALDDATKQEVVEFVNLNRKRLREVSLRTVIKAADLAVTFPSRWKTVADTTLMK